jgi:hypothetical protein
LLPAAPRWVTRPKNRSLGDRRGPQPGTERPHGAGVLSNATHDPYLGTFTACTGFGAGDPQPQPGQRRSDAGHIEADELGAAQGASEADQQQGAISEAS